MIDTICTALGLAVVISPMTLIIAPLLIALGNFLWRKDTNLWGFSYKLNLCEHQSFSLHVVSSVACVISVIILIVTGREHFFCGKHSVEPFYNFIGTGACYILAFVATMYFIRLICDLIKGLQYRHKTGKLDELETLKQRITKLENK